MTNGRDRMRSCSPEVWEVRSLGAASNFFEPQLCTLPLPASLRPIVAGSTRHPGHRELFWRETEAGWRAAASKGQQGGQCTRRNRQVAAVPHLP